jgi:hypothetical protein
MGGGELEGSKTGHFQPCWMHGSQDQNAHCDGAASSLDGQTLAMLAISGEQEMLC